MKIKNIVSIIFCYLFICGQVIAQNAALLPEGKIQFLDNNGNPLSSGKVDFFIPSTTTRKTTWQDAAKTIANTNPVVLDAGGRAIIYGDGTYRQVVKNSANSTIYDALTTSSGAGNTPTAFGDGAAVGSIKSWAGLIVPANYAYAYGQELSRATYSSLFTAITLTQNVSCSSGSPVLTGLSDTSQIPIQGILESTCIPPGSAVLSKTSTTVTMNNNSSLTTSTTGVFFLYGNGNGSTTFNIPDLRGNVIAGRCNMGGIDCTNLTATGFGVTASSTGQKGGAQTRVLITNNFPPYTPVGFNGTITATGTVSAPTITINNGTNVTTGSTFGAGAGTTGGTNVNITATSSVPIFTGTPTAGPNWVGTAQGGISAPLSIVQPTVTLNYIIKILPDINLSIGNVVTSLGGLTGDINCGTWLSCISNNISISIPAGPATILMNPSNSSVAANLFTIQGLVLQSSPSPTNDYVPLFNAASGTIQKVTPATLGSTGVAGVSSLGGMVGGINCSISIVCGSATIGLSTGFFNVKNATFGAIGNGVADDTTAIKAACTAAAISGGTVYLPSGTYLITMILNPGGDYALDCSGIGVNIIGDGQGVTIIKNKNAAAVVSTLRTTGTQQSVRNLTIDGNRLNGGGAIYAVNPNSAGITVLGSHFTLDNVEIKNSETQGIIFGASTDYMIVTNNYLHNNGTTTDIWGVGIKLTNSPSAVGGIFKSNVINDNFGLTVPGPSGSCVGGGAIALDGTQMVVTHNIMTNNYNCGGQIAEQNAGGVQGLVRDWVISNNVFLISSEPAGANTYGIEISGQNYTITSNMFDGGKGGCITFETAPTFVSGNATFSGNTCINTGYGVHLIQVGGGIPRFITISGNKFKGASQLSVVTSTNTSQIGIFSNQFSEVLTAITNTAAAGEILVESNIPATIGIPWTNSTISAAPSIGSFTATSAINYHLSAKSVFIQININISNNNTGAGNITITGLPFTLATACVIAGRGNNVSGKMVQGAMGGTGGVVINYDSTYPGATGEALILSGVCQVT